MISGVTSRVAIDITHIRGCITLLTTIHEPPSRISMDPLGPESRKKAHLQGCFEKAPRSSPALVARRIQVILFGFYFGGPNDYPTY